MAGKVKQITTNQQDSFSYTFFIEQENIPPGFYIYQIQRENENSITGKLIVKSQ